MLVPSFKENPELIEAIEKIDSVYIKECKKEWDTNDFNNYQEGIKELRCEIEESELIKMKLEFIDNRLFKLNKLFEKLEAWKSNVIFDRTHPAWLFHATLDISPWFSILKERGSLVKRKTLLENPSMTSKNWVSREEIETALKVPFNTLIKLDSKNGARCPFHSDKNPSFHVFKSNTAYCFGCGWSGNSISFIMKSQDLKFNEAVKYLIG